MSHRSLTHSSGALWILLLAAALSACTTRTVEVTRIKILERRVIERIEVTVQVTRVYRVVETPKPTFNDVIPAQSDVDVQPTPEATSSTPTAGPASATPSPVATATQPRSPPAPTRTSVPSITGIGQSLLVALKNAEQTLLSLQQTLNSDPLPVDAFIQLYDALARAPVLSIPDDEATLQAFYVRYREQIDTAVGQATDLYNHAVQIQAGNAAQTEISAIHLSVAQSAASASTSMVQGLIRELEDYLASLP